MRAVTSVVAHRATSSRRAAGAAVPFPSRRARVPAETNPDSFTRSSSVMSTASASTPPCTTPVRWAASSARASWRPMATTRAGSSGPYRRMSSASVGPLVRSVTMNGTPPVCPLS